MVTHNLYNYSFASNSGSYNLPWEEMKSYFGDESKLLTETVSMPPYFLHMLFTSLYHQGKSWLQANTAHGH